MKKHFLTLCFLLVSFVVFAGKFVLIPVTENNNLETLFAYYDLKIHYYCDDYVLATTDNLNFTGLVVLDENAFADDKTYAKVYCSENNKNEFLTRSAKTSKVLYSGNNFFIMQILSADFQPAKNDGTVAILNIEASLPKSVDNYPVITEVDENVLNCISQVNTESVMGYIQTLENFGTRYAQHAQHIAARNWIKQQYDEMGLDSVYLQAFTWYSGTNHNVIAIQEGKDPDLKKEYIVIGAHYDSYTYESQSNAPGADDNASGTAGIMETARILSQYDFKRSIIYCSFSAEELGLYGSDAFAQKCKNEQMNILGYFNLDMIGYLKAENEMKIYLIYPTSALTLANYFVNVCDIYFPGKVIKKQNHWLMEYSDQQSFNQKGFKGIWWFEDVDCDSPYIHHIPGGTVYGGCTTSCLGTVPCVGDVIGPSVNNPTQVTLFTQAMVASVATLAEIDGPPPPPLNPPINCNAEYFEEMSILVTWDAPVETTPNLYDVYRDDVKIMQQVGLIYMDTVADYQNHCYKIKAIYDEGASVFSNESCAAVPFVPLAPPTNCLATNYFELSIKIIWDVPEESTPDGYFVYRDNDKIFEEAISATEFFDIPNEEGEYCYKVSALYGEIESEFSNSSCAWAYNGINEYDSKIKVYPNPTTGELRIETSDMRYGISDVTIFDIYGRKLVSNLKSQISNQIINISHFHSGIYFLKIETEQGTIMKKVIKN